MRYTLIALTAFLFNGCSENTEMPEFKKLPKVELHLHLDCSLSYEVVKQIDSSITVQQYNDSFIAPAKCNDLADYIKRAVKGVELMQTREQLRFVTLDLFKQLKNDNVLYAEIRFAPLLHTFKGLSSFEVVETVNNAVVEGIKTTGVKAGLILCTLRHFTEAQSMETVELVKNFKGSTVVGFDIAADEAGFPIDNHIKAFQFANQHQLNCTAHAGEAKGAESVWETIREFKPSRIGHGVRSAEDKKLLSYLKKSNIHLEICPTSNIQTNVFSKITDHSLNTIYNSGVSMSLNTDARTISNVTLSSEYEKVYKIFKWRKEDFLKCNIEAIEHSFMKQGQKEELKKMITEKYQ